MDVWGEPGVTAEAELIAAVFTLLERLGLGAGQVKVRLSSRALLEDILGESVLRERRSAFAPLCIVIDKLEKIGPAAVLERLVDPEGPVALSRGAAEEVVAARAVRDLEEAARRAPAGSPAVAELRRLFELLAAYGVAGRVVFDASIVRGLAYYTGVVFEAFDAEGELRSICGGGRYDRLLETLGGPPLPAVGFGFGDVVIGELLAERKLLPELARRLDDVVFPFTDRERPAAIRLAQRLREAGRSVELVLAAGRLKRVLADADRSGARRIHLLGPDEAARGVARVRDLATGEERDEPLQLPGEFPD
jgi:histidyl-tRNA synthetase